MSILTQYGQDSEAASNLRASNGGKMEVKEVPYSPPKGPAGQMRGKPGNGGTNHGNCGSQGKY